MPEPTIHDWPLPYITELDERPLDAIDLVVIHCTELPNLAMARNWGARARYANGTGNSGHYYIGRGGSIYGFVPDHRTANHTRGFNPRSIGIELINNGRYPDWLDSRHQAMTEPYPAAQIASLRDLLTHLVNTIPSLTLIAGHEDLDTAQVPASDNDQLRVPRKRDPGPLFPWPAVLADFPLQRSPTAE